MRDFKVLVNDKPADIGNPDDFNIVIHRELLDFSRPNSQGGDHTYDVVFPPTKVNAEIFGPAMADYRTSKKFRSVQSLKIAIYSNGQRIFDGVPIIKEASPNVGYTVTMFGNDIDWASLLESRSMRDLVLPDSPFTGTRIYGAPIEPTGPLTARDITQLDDSETIVQFPLVAYGNYFVAGGLGLGLLANRVQEIGWQQVPPSVFVVPLIKAILNQAGYQLSSDFFELEEVRKQVMAYTGDMAPRWNWGLLARANASNTSYLYGAIPFPSFANYDYQIGRSLIWRLVTGTVNWNYADSYFQSSPPEQYVAPVSGKYRFNIDTGNITLNKNLEGTLGSPPIYPYLRTAIAIVVIPSDPDELLELQISIADYIGVATVSVVSNPNVIAFYDFGTGYQESPYTLLPFTVGGTYSQVHTGGTGSPGDSLDGTGNVTISIEDVDLPLGARVGFWLVSQYGVFDPIASTSITFDSYVLDIKETSYSDELEIAPLLPDITQGTFLKWIVTAFNLLFSVDQVKKIIRFEPRDSFYLSNRFAQDWSALGDIAKNGIRPIPFYDRTTFAWSADDNDSLLSRFGSLQFNQVVNVDGTYATADNEQIEVGFAPTYEREFQFKGLGGGAPLISTVIVPCMASASQLNTIQNDIEWEYGYRPRLLKYIGLQPGYWKQDGTVYPDYPAARFSFDETGGFSLAFQQGAGRVVRGNGLVLSPVQNDGLYRLFWRSFINLRQQSHIQSVEVLLDAADFAAADVSVPIVMNGLHYWLYNFVDPFDPITPSRMKVDLIRQV